MEVTIEVNRTIQSKGNVVVELPYFSVCGNAMYKVYSQEKALQVAHYPNIEGSSICQVGSRLAFESDCYETTEALFNEHYETVINQLNSL